MLKKPKYGQHFLKHIHYAMKAVEAAELSPEDAVIEVGPGKGVLTKYLLPKAGLVLALEIDSRFIDKLKEKFENHNNFEVRNLDARYISWDEVIGELREKGFKRIKLVANLPYYMATQMVMHVLASKARCDRLVVMVQDEVGRRLCSEPGSKDYSALSVAARYYSEPHYVCRVPAKAFNPPPLVSSAIIRLDKREAPQVHVSDEEMFLYLVRSAFTHRRKTLRKCLQGLERAPRQEYWESALARAGIDSQRRPETLSLQEFADINQALGDWMVPQPKEN
ncbi:MAG: 16S rRNA (adenine(1518)-N(6)/adenine(1519)-N(6))-dimethyltransferase RsmA [candidate division FCPU426 bacterium]